MLAATAGILLAAPLAGVWLAGHPLAPYLDLPPRPGNQAAAGFSWPVFSIMAALVIAAVAPLAYRVVASGKRPSPVHSGAQFPRWGYAAIAFLAAGWALAWTRFDWFAAFQQHTFTPLWLGYIAVVNALVVGRKGSSIATRRPGRFAALFAVSALFWWCFEYLNRFVGNWRYAGIDDFGAIEYTLFASASFSTVLPAVASTAEYLGTFPRLDAAFREWIEVRISRKKPLAAAALAAAALLLAALGLAPDYLYPFVWIAPAAVLIALQALTGSPTVLNPLGRGDWRGFVAWPAAALVCGFFWEMWNYGSQAHWVYDVPHAHAFLLFEMPLLGYAGYLPFGIECAVIASLVLCDEAFLPSGQWTGRSR